MKPKHLVTAVLLGFVAASLVYLVFGPGDAAQPETQPTVAGTQPERQIVVTFYHRAERCDACRTVERLADALIHDRFAAALADGRLVWRKVAYGEGRHTDAVKRYELFTLAIVLTEMEAGREVRWKKLDEVPFIYDDPPAFDRYVHDAIADYLRGSP